jgi:hypothetical protein
MAATVVGGVGAASVAGASWVNARRPECAAPQDQPNRRRVA